MPEHRDIVRHIAQGQDRIRRDARYPRHRIDEGPLVDTRRRDVEIVGLRADGACRVTERGLHRGLTALQQIEVVADADDLAELG